jgi:hypothetical protein
MKPSKWLIYKGMSKYVTLENEINVMKIVKCPLTILV